MRTLYTDSAGNKLTYDETDNKLSGFNAEGQMLDMASIKSLVFHSTLDIKFFVKNKKQFSSIDESLLK